MARRGLAPMNIAPTKVQSNIALTAKDYRLKVSITPRVTCGAKRSPVDADVMNDLLKSDLAAF